MTIYFGFLISIIIIGLVYERQSDILTKNVIVFIFIFATSFIFGLRNEVGVDWFNYIAVYERSILNPFKIDTVEVGFKWLNIISDSLGFGIHGVVFLSTLLTIGISSIALCRLNLNPFYFHSIVFPYFFVMAGMNFTRQAIALSIFIYALSFLLDNKKLLFFLITLFGASFHSSMIIFSLLTFIDARKIFLIINLLLSVILVIFLLIVEFNQYLDGSTDNAGLLLRALFLLVPAVLIINRARVIGNMDLVSQRLLFIVVFSFPIIMAMATVSSTVSDRFSYYFIVMSVLTWMHFYRKSTPLESDVITRSGSIIMFAASFIAFITWVLFSSYIYAYRFNALYLDGFL